MNGHACRLIDGDQVVVLIEDVEGNILGACMQRFQLKRLNVNLFAASQCV
jgi:hypothetical protein